VLTGIWFLSGISLSSEDLVKHLHRLQVKVTEEKIKDLLQSTIPLSSPVGMAAFFNVYIVIHRTVLCF